MKVLGIVGSARREGNTSKLVERVMAGAAAAGAITETIYLCALEYRPCDGCDSCELTGRCVIDDDLQSVYAKLDETDALVLGSPIYWNGLTAQTKGLIDRCQCLWNRRFELRQTPRGPRRPAYFISVGGQRAPRFDAAIPTVRLWFAVLWFRYAGDLLVPNVDAPHDVLDHPDVLSSAFDLGKRLVIRD